MAETVLLVEDDPGMLAAYRRFLGPGFVVETAAGGAEAMEVLARAVQKLVARQVRSIRGVATDRAERRCHTSGRDSMTLARADLGRTPRSRSGGDRR